MNNETQIETLAAEHAAICSQIATMPTDTEEGFARYCAALERRRAILAEMAKLRG